MPACHISCSLLVVPGIDDYNHPASNSLSESILVKLNHHYGTRLGLQAGFCLIRLLPGFSCGPPLISDTRHLLSPTDAGLHVDAQLKMTIVYMYICVYVCVYVYMYVYICICVYICVCICMHVCMHVCVYVCMYMYVYVCVVYVCVLSLLP